MNQHDAPERIRPVALVTGASRRIGIGAAVAERLAADGFDVGITCWTAYDARMPWGRDAGDGEVVLSRLRSSGARTTLIEADLAEVETPAAVFDAVERDLGAVSTLVLCHCESVNSGILDTTVEGFDRHFAVNARATWLLIGEFGRRFVGPRGSGRVIGMTSDHTVGNLPYGASKAALERITLAAAHEFADLGITANVINPGATDTGWMTPALQAGVIAATPLARVGLPSDVANLVAFLCSAQGGWINGQLLHSNGAVTQGP